MKLRTAHIAGVSQPLLAILGSSAVTVRDSRKARGLVVDARKNASAIDGQSGIFHEPQKESGISSQFLNGETPRATIDRLRGKSRFPSTAVAPLKAAAASLEAARSLVDRPRGEVTRRFHRQSENIPHHG